MTTIEDYFVRQKELEAKYGSESVVLMQVGSFYEAYGVSGEIGHAENVGKILSMQVAYKNGRDKPHNIKNPQMVGFPDYALGNHLEKLLRANYTVAIYNQFDVPGKKEKIRKLVNVYSPGTFIDSEIDNEQSGLATVATLTFKCPISKKTTIYAHFIYIDLSHGDVCMTSVYNTADDNKKVDTELYRLIHTYNPSEIIYSGIQNINDYDCGNKKVYKQDLVSTYKDIAYQNAFLAKVYKVVTIATPIEALGLTHHADLLPYFIQGLQYAYSHDPLILQKIKVPTFIQTDKRLILNNDSIYQLHIISNSIGALRAPKSLFEVLDCNRTVMGKRLLKSRLLMPTSSKKVLRSRYARIEKMKNYEEYEEKLKNIVDIDRTLRKMATRKMQPYEFAQCRDSFSSIAELLKLGKDNFDISKSIIVEFDEFCKRFDETFIIEELKVAKLQNVKNSYFRAGVSQAVDAIEEKIKKNKESLEAFAQKLEYATLAYTATDGYYYKTTPLRYKKIAKKHPDLTASVLTNTVKISTPETDILSAETIEAESQLSEIITQEYLNIITLWSESDLLYRVSNIIAEIDFTQSAAKVAKLYGYTKPMLLKKGPSQLKAKKLRHPIIERIVTKSHYVSNDVELGVDKNGMIVYGVNMSGKSSLLRSIGTAVVMAQAGLFVSAESFEFYPYKQILSKITVQDNPFKGQSLFMVEMEEVHNMIRRGDNRTLVLSDELCSSTETSSAHAIVACTLKSLADKGVNFVFSTHLHELQRIPQIRDNAKIAIMHFKVTVKDSQMHFDRTLQSGGIPDTYGLEIAQAIGLPTDFIKEAFTIRDNLKNSNPSILSTKKSRYNSQIYMDKCSLCGTTKALDTHHIQEQHTATKEGLIVSETAVIQKNQAFNLLVVCRDCHQKIHFPN